MLVIYKVTNLANGKCYIGQTTRSLEQRWKEHCSSRNPCTYLHSAIEKYGKNNFKVEEIDVALSQEELDAKERKYIAYYNTLAPHGYNLETGGTNGKTISETTRRKQSESHKGKPPGNAKQKRTKEWVKHMSDAKKGEKHPLFGKPHPHRLPVICVETGVVYDSFKTAQLETKIRHINEVCRGKRKLAGGYHWSYYHTEIS